MVINNGKIVEDGPLQSLIDRLAPYRLLVIDLAAPQEDITHYAAEIIKREKQRVWFRFDKSKITAAELISDLSLHYHIKDLSVKEPDIEEMIRELYKNTV